MSREHLRRHTVLISFGVLFLLAVLPLVGVLGPRVEARLLPVIIDTQETWSRDGRNITVNSEFNKVRPDCRIEQARYDFKPLGGPAVEVSREARENRSNGGDMKLSTAYLVSPHATYPGQLRRVFYYRCHPFWLTPYIHQQLRIE